jgi:RHS repeat-associated protein
VYFDNLQLIHDRSPLLEETHYYPFGLTMAGISSKAANITENRLKFNGYEQQSKEFSDGSGLEWYDYKNRFYDNQLGRFFCVDRLADKFPYYTPYQFAGNEPTVAIDLDGLEPLYVIDSKNPTDYSKKENREAAKQALLKYSSFTDLNDAAVLTTMGTRGSANAINIDGTPATDTDKGFAIAGAFIPFVSGSLVKKVFNGFSNLFSANKALSVWTKNALERGLEIEKMLGGNLPDNFPVIDKLKDGVATSIKSIDVTLDSYTKGNGLLNTLNGYINKLDNFSTGSLSGVTVTEGVNFTTKSLEVAIQPGKATLSQWEQIGKAMEIAKGKDIEFKLQFIK